MEEPHRDRRGVVANIERLSLHLLDVGKGDAILIDFPDGSFGLIDTGPDKRCSGIVRLIERRIAAKRMFRFAAITHWDLDHAAGMPIVLGYGPRYFYRPEVDLDLLERLCGGRGELSDDIARARGKDVVEEPVYARKPLDAPDGVSIVALSPDQHVRDEIKETIRSGGTGMTVNQMKRFRNRASVALWLRFADIRLFLTGEIEEEQFDVVRALFHARVDPVRDSCGSMRAHWIKLSHHGASGNNPPTLFQYFTAEEFVASASAGGANGHPHPTVLRQVIEHRGRAMCTRLGQGCSHILRKQLDPNPDDWLTGVRLKELPNPRQVCYGTITIEIARYKDMVNCQVIGDSVQARCPYGGPPDGWLILSAR